MDYVYFDEQIPLLTHEQEEFLIRRRRQSMPPQDKTNQPLNSEDVEKQTGQTQAGSEQNLTPQAKAQLDQANKAKAADTTQTAATTQATAGTGGGGAQAQDKDKQPLVVGDAITITGTIVELNEQNDRHMNITIETSENMYPTDRKSRISLNSRQVTKKV